MKRTIYLNEHLEEQIGKIARFLNIPVSTFIRLVLEQTDFEAMAQILELPQEDIVKKLLEAVEATMKGDEAINGK